MTVLEPNSFLLKGNVYLQKEKYHQAIIYYKKFLKNEPNNIFAHNNLGVAYHQLGNTQEALLAYQSAINRKADYYDATYNLAVLLKGENLLKHAAYYFNQAMRIDKKNVLAAVGLAQTLSLLGETEKSFIMYEQIMHMLPENIDFITETAKLEMKRKRYGQAEMLFRAAAKHQKFNPFVWQNIAICLKMQGKMQDALACLKLSISLNPHLSSIQYTTGIIYYEIGMIQEAMEHIEKAFMLDASMREDYKSIAMPAIAHKGKN